jgi:hypothetical protein
MRLGMPDRVPVMCQLSIGHLLLHSGVPPLDLWYTSDGFAEALVTMQRRYRFDGILVNLPGRDPEWRRHTLEIGRDDEGTRIRWRNGDTTLLPPDDLPLITTADGVRPAARFDAIDPGQLFYVEPYEPYGVGYPAARVPDGGRQVGDERFSPHQCATLRRVRELAGAEVSVHAEVFSPWSQFLELLDYEQALLAMLDDTPRTLACLARLAEGAAALGRLLASAGADAILISSAFAGAGFLSRKHYETFVLPFERRVVEGIRSAGDLPVYTHTCGAIGDRLDLMLATGTDGIDTLDPPPLGTVELEQAKRELAGRAFIKGNIDPVNTLLAGTPDDVRADARRRLAVGSAGGGYILSTACSVAPHTPPENIMVLADVSEETRAGA